jgi:hypothetical protein
MVGSMQATPTSLVGGGGKPTSSSPLVYTMCPPPRSMGVSYQTFDLGKVCDHVTYVWHDRLIAC